VDPAALRHLLPPEFGKHLMQRERALGIQLGGGGASTPHSLPPVPQNPLQREISPPLGAPPVASPAPAPLDLRFRADDRQDAPPAPKHPMQREAPPPMAADAHRCPQTPDRPSPTGQPGPATIPPPSTIRRPILLARPKLHAT
jgi:hypothetical protein